MSTCRTDLEDVISNVTENLVVVEREVQDRQGRWYSLQVRPYRTQDSRIDGVVLMLDIEELKQAMAEMVAIVRHPLLLLCGDLTVSRANEAFCRTFQVTAEETENRHLYALGNGQWNLPQLRNSWKIFCRNRSRSTIFPWNIVFRKSGGGRCWSTRGVSIATNAECSVLPSLLRMLRTAHRLE